MKTLFVSVIALGLIIMTSQAIPAPDQLPDFDKLWDYDHPAQTRAKFNDILPRAEVSGDNNYLNQILTQIARTYGLEGKFDSANAVLDSVQKQLPKEPNVGTVRYYLERGRTYRSSGDPQKAEPLFEKAFHLAHQLNADYYAIDAAHMVALAVKDQQKKREWSELGLKMAEESSDKRARSWKGPLSNNMGWDYFDSGDYNKALELFQQAYGSFKESGKEKQIDIARWTIARCLRALGRDDEALATQLDLLKKYQEDGTEDGYVYEELGELYLKRGDKEKATGYFAKAYNLLSTDKWLMENEPERMDRMKTLGGIQ